MSDSGPYTTQVTEHRIPGLGWARKLSVERIDGLDGIPWDDLQALKDEAFGRDAAAVEVYPPADEVVNERNRRHLWEWPRSECPFSLWTPGASAQGPWMSSPDSLPGAGGA